MTEIIPDFLETIKQITMFDKKEEEKITINEHIDNNIGSILTKTDIVTTGSTVLITLIIIILVLYIGYKINKYYKNYVRKQIARKNIQESV